MGNNATPAGDSAGHDQERIGDQPRTDGGAAVLTDLTAFQRDCLAVLAARDDEPPGTRKGLAIKAALDAYYGHVNYGRLYQNLDGLAEKGLVEKGSIDDRTNEYRLTDRGRRELRAHVAFLANGIEPDDSGMADLGRAYRRGEEVSQS